MRKSFLSHSWPGNVRELRNVIERVVIFGPTALRIGDPPAVASVGATLPFPSDMESIQQAAARAMVERHRGNKSAAATALGISRKRLYSLLVQSAPTLEIALSRDQSQPTLVHEGARPSGAELGLWI
jgi:DNA-binding NtrC family response regulator